MAWLIASLGYASLFTTRLCSMKGLPKFDFRILGERTVTIIGLNSPRAPDRGQFCSFVPAFSAQRFIGTLAHSHENFLDDCQTIGSIEWLRNVI